VCLHNVIDGARVAVNLCTALGEVTASYFKVFDVVVAVILHREVSFHQVVKACLAPLKSKVNLGKSNLLGVFNGGSADATGSASLMQGRAYAAKDNQGQERNKTATRGAHSNFLPAVWAYLGVSTDLLFALFAGAQRHLYLLLQAFPEGYYIPK